MPDGRLSSTAFKICLYSATPAEASRFWRGSAMDGDCIFEPTERRRRHRKLLEATVEQRRHIAWIGRHVAAQADRGASFLSMRHCPSDELEHCGIERIGERRQLAVAAIASSHILHQVVAADRVEVG